MARRSRLFVVRVLASVFVVAATACTLVTSLDGFSEGSDGQGDGGDAGVVPGDGSAALDGASGDAADAADSGISRVGCPSGKGPLQVRIDLPAGPYCIDSTEVTRGQYDQFLSSSPTNTHPRCGFNASFVPTRQWPYAPSRANHPVVGVDWCDAYAFCKWAGKELCGSTTGGAISTSLVRDTARAAHATACSKSGTRVYPYGNTFSGGACNDVVFGAGDTIEVATAPRCEGGYLGIFDLSGNVAEWMDACIESPDGGADDQCRAFNSSYVEGQDIDLTCTSIRSSSRSFADSLYGFRCCAIP